MITAFVEERGVNGRGRAILKPFLMKASQYRVSFGGFQRPRHEPHGGIRRRRNTPETPFL
jgi:hypothetical protein